MPRPPSPRKSADPKPATGRPAGRVLSPQDRAIVRMWCEHVHDSVEKAAHALGMSNHLAKALPARPATEPRKLSVAARRKLWQAIAESEHGVIVASGLTMESRAEYDAARRSPFMAPPKHGRGVAAVGSLA